MNIPEKPDNILLQIEDASRASVVLMDMTYFFDEGKLKRKIYTLVYRIDVHARLLILRKKSPLYGLILVCTFIDFQKKFPPARLFHPARLLVLICSKFHSTHDPEQSIPQYCQSNPKAISKYSKVFQRIPKYPKTSQSIPKIQCQEIASQKFSPARSYFGLHVY